MLELPARVEHAPAARGQEPGKEGGPEVHDEGPVTSHASGPKLEPVERKGLLFHHDDAGKIGHGLEQGRRHGAAGDGDAGIRVFGDQVIQNACGQHRVADPARGNEKDVHDENAP